MKLTVEPSLNIKTCHKKKIKNFKVINCNLLLHKIIHNKYKLFNIFFSHLVWLLNKMNSLRPERAHLEVGGSLQCIKIKTPFGLGPELPVIFGGVNSTVF